MLRQVSSVVERCELRAMGQCNGGEGTVSSGGVVWEVASVGQAPSRAGDGD